MVHYVVLPPCYEILQIVMHTGTGPAMYLEIHHDSLGQIDVDLVPAFQFPLDHLRGQPGISDSAMMRTNHVSWVATV